MAITEELLTGLNVASCLEDLAALRISVFREYPYLYAGRTEDELTYLRLYMETQDACVITVSDSGTVAGAATGIPLRYEHDGMVAPFTGSTYPLAELFYVGELLFYPAYRNLGLGVRLLNHIEKYVRHLEQYRYLTCATVVRPAGHGQCPGDYVPIERFLNRTGFTLLSGVTTSIAWRETDGVSREHPMQFWLKELSR